MAIRERQGRANQTLERRTRLTTGSQFRHVFAHPQVTQDRYFRVLRRANDVGHCRLGMAVSRKICPTATGRNRLKRIIRESFRLHRESLDRRGGWDLVVLPGKASPVTDNASLRASLESHWQKVTNDDSASSG